MGSWPFIRPANVNPVITPNPKSTFWDPMSDRQIALEANDVGNPAPVVKKGKIYVLFHSEDKLGKVIGECTSRLGFAEGTNGIKMKRISKPVFYPAKDDQKEFDYHSLAVINRSFRAFWALKVSIGGSP